MTTNSMKPLNGPTPEIARLMPATCAGCGAWTQLGKLRLCHVCHNARYDALEELREIAGMYCEQLPAEVQGALHAIPYNDKQHRHS